MEFPVYLHVGPLAVHPHWFFESLGYILGCQLYARLRARLGDTIANETRGWIVVAAFVGAVFGGKFVYWLSDPGLLLSHIDDPAYVMGGKSIVGALAGGFVAVELAKRRLGVTRATGDLFVFPLVVGIAVGRIGCFLTGLEDRTYGLPTNLPWAVDFGDGTPRHPTQLYEIAFLVLVLLPVLLLVRRRRRLLDGNLFKLFMVGYLGFRLLLETIKPGVFWAGLNAIQWVCVAILVYYCMLAGRQLRPLLRRRDAVHA